MYHVIARGNDRQRVFLDEADFASYLETLTACVDRFGWYCHAYCLMSNHYHLVLETPRPNLPLGMRQLNGLHAQRFNRRHDRCGHLFQSRYRSILVERETYLLALCRYVVVNPVRASICSDVEEWPWSSYAATAGLAQPPPFLSTDWLLSQFAPRRRLAERSYREYVAEGSTSSSSFRSPASDSARMTS